MKKTGADPFPSETPVLVSRGVKQRDKGPSRPQWSPLPLEARFFSSTLAWERVHAAPALVRGKGRNVVGRTAASVRQQAAFVRGVSPLPRVI